MNSSVGPRKAQPPEDTQKAVQLPKIIFGFTNPKKIEKLKKDNPDIAKNLQTIVIDALKTIQNLSGHTLDVTVSKADASLKSFYVVMDIDTSNEKHFTVTCYKDKPAAIIEHPLTRSSWLKDFTQFWNLVVNFFSSWAYHTEEESHLVKQYGQLRQNIEAAHQFLEYKHTSGPSNEDQSTLKNKTSQVLSNAKAIESALYSRDPAIELQSLAEKWGSAAIENSEELIIPTGYRRNDGSFQPMMLRILPPTATSLTIELYCDATDTPQGIPLRQWTLTHQQNPMELSNIIYACLTPLITSREQEVSKPSHIFSIGAKALIESPLAEQVSKQAGISLSPEILTTETPSDISVSPNITFSELVGKLDGNQALQRVDSPNKNLTQQASTSEERIVKWFDHLLGENQQLSSNEKLSILFALAQESVDSQLSGISQSMNPEKKRGVYQNCLNQLKHTRGELAKAIAYEGTETLLVPASFARLERKCAEGFKETDIECQQHKAELSSSYFLNPHKTNVQLNTSVTVQAPSQNQQIEVFPDHADLFTTMQQGWNDLTKELHTSLDPKIHYQNALKQAQAYLKKHDIPFDGNVNRESIRKVLENFLLDQEFYGPLKSFLIKELQFKNSFPDANPFIDILTDLILSPNVIPRDFDTRTVIKLIRFLQDDTYLVPVANQNLIDALRAILQLQHLASKKERQINAEHVWNQTYSENLVNTPLSFPKMGLGIQDSPINLSSINLNESIENPQPLSPIVKMVIHCDEVMQLANKETHIETKKLLIQQAKDRALELLLMLPTPGSESVKGVTSPYVLMNQHDQMLLLEEIAKLEKIVWQAQMKLSKPSLSGRERFLLLKADIIRQKIVKALAQEARRQIYKLYLDPANQQDFLNAKIDINAKWPSHKFLEDPKAFEFISKVLPADLKDFLLVDWNWINAEEINAQLTQDLTLLLSSNADLEDQVLSLYHFTLHTQQKQVFGLLQTSKQRFENLNLVPTLTNGPAKQLASSIIKSIFYYMTASQPDCFLGAELSKDETYFQARPNALLLADDIEINLDHSGASIISDNNEITRLSDTPRTLPKVPTLPTSLKDRFISAFSVKDLRTFGTDLEWEAYAREEVRELSLDITAATYMQLLKIRSCSPFQAYLPTYSNSVAIQAFDFALDPYHLNDLKNPFVQKFLEETLFGAFIMQQAIIERPEMLLSKIQLLDKQYQRALDTNKLEAAAFLANIIVQLKAHVQFTLKNLQQQGILSPLYSKTLPSAILRDPALDHSPQKGIDPTPNNLIRSYQPLTSTLMKVQECEKALDEIDLIPADMLCFSNRVIDFSKNENEKERFYFNALNSLRFKQSLSKDEIQNVLESYRFLLLADSQKNKQKESHPPYEEIFAWVRHHVTPQFEALSKSEKINILEGLSKIDKQNVSLPGADDIIQMAPGVYLLRNTKQIPQTELLINLGATLIRQDTALPKEITEDPPFLQALKTAPAMTRMTKNPPATTYEWEHQKQKFQLELIGSKWTLSRTLRDGNEDRTYTFHPQSIQFPQSSAQILLNQNGMWISPSPTEKIRVFTRGMDHPSSDSSYVITQNEEGFLINSAEGHVISNEPVRGESPIDFVGLQNFVSLVDSNNNMRELRFLNADISFKLTSGWTCFQSGREIGKVAAPKEQERKKLIHLFGQDWPKFIIPLVQNGKRSFLMLPYSEKLDLSGKPSLDLNNPSKIYPEIITLNPNGTLQGSVVANLSLANHFLRRAIHETNSSIAAQLFLQCNAYIMNLATLRPSANEILAIKRMINEAEKFIFSGNRKMPSPEAAAITLRMFLAIDNIRKQAEDTTLQLTEKERFNQSEKIHQLFENYDNLKFPGIDDPRSFGTVSGLEVVPLPALKHRADLMLSVQEIANLQQKNRIIRDQFVNNLDLAEYFGLSMENVEGLSIDAPTALNPQFLLALLRYAEPPNKDISLKDVSPPLTLLGLLKNFWSYAQSIRTGNIQMEDLRFLFSASKLPPPAAEFAAIDLQARQYLLSFALFENQIHPAGKSIEELILEKITIVSEKLESVSNNQTIPDDIKDSIIDLIASVQELKEKRIDFKALPEKISYIRTRLFNLIDLLGKTSALDAKAKATLGPFLLQCLDVYEKLGKILSENKNFQKVIEMDEKLNELYKSLQQFSPQPNLNLPESQVLQEAMLTAIQSGGTQLPDTAGKLSILMDINIADSIRLGMNLPDPKKMKEKVVAMAAPLIGISTILQQSKKQTIQIAAKETSATKPIETSVLLNDLRFKSSFTPEQQRKIENSLHRVSENKKAPLLERLADILSLDDKYIALQTNTRVNLELVNTLYDSVIQKSKLHPPTFDSIKAITRTSNFKEKFAEFFETVNIDFVSRHNKICDSLKEVLPDDQEPQYSQDLEKGIENVKNTPPLPNTPFLKESKLDEIENSLNSEIAGLQGNIKTQSEGILAALKNNVETSNLPLELRLLRAKHSTSEADFLEAALKLYRQGTFADTHNFPEIDRLISNYLIDSTRLKLLTGGILNAQKSLTILKTITAKRQQLRQDYKVEADPKEIEKIQEKYNSTERELRKQSEVLIQCLDQCQTFSIDSIPKELQPHIRKILYLQNRLGIVLRDDQLLALKEIVTLPNLLKQMRMGRGKTSTLLPFALEILASMGINPIGIVPKGLFASNFNEMDETTRAVFDLCGAKFLFSRESAPLPLTVTTIGQIASQATDFLKALQNSYCLTTIESKASLDNKIVEVEESQKALVALAKMPTDSDENEEIQKARKEALEYNLINHEIALKTLYKIKAIFHHKNTRLIVDEVDQTTRSNYSVNSEIGKPDSPDLTLVSTANSIFNIIQNAHDKPLLELKQAILENQQFAIKDKTQIDKYLRAIGKEWLNKNAPKLHEHENALLEWFTGGTISPAILKTAPPGLLQNLYSLHRALNKSLRSSLSLQVGNHCDVDALHGVVGVPMTGGKVSITTKYSDPLMQLVLTQMIALYKPPSETFLKNHAHAVYDSLSEETDLVAKEALKDAMEKQLPLTTMLKGNDPWKLMLRLKFAERVIDQDLIFVSERRIAQSVQHALSGCNIIGLTGTASRETGDLIQKQENDGSMQDFNDHGRESTAEVLYRFANSLPNGLDTPVETFPVESNAAFEKHKYLARAENGYDGLIDQAGSCDQKSQYSKVKAMHDASKRPIVFQSVRTDQKSVYMNKEVKLLSDLTEDELKTVKENAFYYYSSSTVRGTNFEIPSGSKLALFLSPTNDSDRDQAAYRARDLGEGHLVVPFISDRQHEQLADESGVVTAGTIFKMNHEVSQKEELDKKVEAFRLNVEGILKVAIDIRKTKMTIKGEPSLDQIYDKQEIIHILQTLPDTGMKKYMKNLAQEALEKEEIDSLDGLIDIIAEQIAKTETFIAKIFKEVPDANRFKEKVIQQLLTTFNTLTAKQNSLKSNWEKLKHSYPQKMKVFSAATETSMVEAQEEVKAEEEQMSIEESIQDIAKNISRNTESLFSSIDPSKLKELHVPRVEITLNTIMESNEILSTDPERIGEKNRWEPIHGLPSAVSAKLIDSIENSTGNQLPILRLIVLQKKDEKPTFFAVTPYQGLNISFDREWTYTEEDKVLLYDRGMLFLQHDTNGYVDLQYEPNSLTASMGNQFVEKPKDPSYKAQALLSLIMLGARKIKPSDLDCIKRYYEMLPKNEQKELHAALEANVKDMEFKNELLELLPLIRQIGEIG